MASFIASPSLVGLPTEILREIMRLVLSPRDIQVIVKSVKNNVVTATPDFPLSPFLVRKALYTASHRILDDGLVLWLHTPFAILHLGSFLPDVIRNRVRYFEIRWGKGHDESLGDEIHRYQKLEHGVFTRQTMLSFPNLEAVLLDADADESCPVEDANDKRELEIRLHQDCSRYLRPFAKDHGGIHLDEFDSFDRAIKVHLHVPTCSFLGTAVNEPDYHFIIATYKTKEKSWAIKDLCWHDHSSAFFEEDGRLAILSGQRFYGIPESAPCTCVRKEWI